LTGRSTNLRFITESFLIPGSENNSHKSFYCIFNPPDGSFVQQRPEGFTTGWRDTLTFALTAKEQAAVDEIVVSFYDDNRSDIVSFQAPK